MAKQHSKISRKVLKYPYNGRFEEDEKVMFSERLCFQTIKVRIKAR